MKTGTTLAEVVIALVCGLLVVQLSFAGLAKVRSVELRLTRRSEILEALRVSRVVLRRELRFGVPGVDWVVFVPDSIRLRAFRGVAFVCPSEAGGPDLLVAWSGTRQPAPAKDSVLLLTVRGAWIRADLSSVRPTSERCAADPRADVERWQLSDTPEEPVVLARLFERGSYHVSGAALRYRRGRGGRQPLTPEVFDTPPSGFVKRGGSLALEWIRLRDGDGLRWLGYLGGQWEGQAQR